MEENNIGNWEVQLPEEEKQEVIPYVSLHNHTMFSIMDSLIKPEDLIKKCKELGMPAVAITDHGNLFGIWDAYIAAGKLGGIKLIAGCEFYFVDDVADKEARIRHVICIAKNQIGYKNLLTLSKKGYDNSIISAKKVIPRIDWKLLEKYHEGMLCTTACGGGILGQILNNKKFEEAEKQAQRLKDIFGDDLAIELQPHALKRNSNFYGEQVDQTFTNRQLKKIAEKLNIKMIAATDSHYLDKTDYAAHDTFLSMGSGQPKKSNNRLRYNVNDFYVKSGTEVKAFFTRTYGEDFANELIANTLYFANKCEKPKWIDPKFTNPSGKELPDFPVYEQEDYKEFLNWKQHNYIDGLADDALYLRYKCEIGLNKMIPVEKHDQYKERLKEEFDVLEFHGFSSYMLVVMDFLEYARKNNIITGVGRGCLTGDALVLSENGYVSLKDIKVNQKVYSHTGKLKTIKDKFEYDVDEGGLEIKTHYSFGTISLTNNHKVYGIHKNDINSDKLEPKWIDAENLNDKNYLFVPFVERGNKIYDESIDISLFINECGKKYKYSFDDKFVYCDKKIKDDDELSLNRISRETNTSLHFVHKLKWKRVSIKDKKLDIIVEYLKSKNISLEDWQNKKPDQYRYDKFFKINNDFCYFIGRFIGDGCYFGESGIKISFNKNDECGISKIENIISSYGFHYSKSNGAYALDPDDNGISMVVYSQLFYHIIKSFFPRYEKNSQTKHLPDLFRKLDNEKLKHLLIGYYDADGDPDTRFKNVTERITTVSPYLAEEVREALLYLKIPSRVSSRQTSRYGVLTQVRYDIICHGLKHEYNPQVPKFIKITDNGYFVKIKEINNIHLNKVYDINVSDDNSYLTNNHVVHNSVGGCLVGYLIGIHQADPIKYDLIFARFHNKDKTSFPDIDSDVTPKGKELVQNYLIEKYGKDQVAHVSNMNTLTPKVYARAIARSYEYGGDRKIAVQMGTNMADAIPKEIKSIKQALQKAPLFIEYAKRYTELNDFSNILDGKPIALSTHAAGLIINKRPLTGLVPLRRDKDGELVLEYEKDRAEANGLIKIDILGLETLSIIENTLKLIKQNGKEVPDVTDYDANDVKTYELVSSGKTYGVFQLGTSGGTMELCRKIQPKCINDLAIINSLARPSAKEIRTDFIKTRNGEKEVELLHPSLQRAFGGTYGYGLFEESLMYLAQDVAGWSLHAADRLRKMTKDKGKSNEKAIKWREEFIDGAIKTGVGKEIAETIWDTVVLEFQGYGFNKAHATFYSMLGYQTAYLKAHFPLEFLVANLMAEVKSNTPDAKSNIAKIKEEIRALKINILPPNVNKSETAYTIINDNTLLTGLDSLKYIGKDAIPEILAKRPFTSFEDFLTKIDGTKVRAPAIQALSAAGCLDSFGLPRKLMYLYASDFKKKLQLHLKKKNKTEFKYPWPEEKEWAIHHLYALETEYLGEGLTGDAFSAYNGFFVKNCYKFTDFSKMLPPPPEDLTEKERRAHSKHVVSVQAIIKSIFEFKVKKADSSLVGQTMAKIKLEDPHGNQLDMTCFPKTWIYFQDRCQEISHGKVKLEPGVGIWFSSSLNWWDDQISLIFEELERICLPPQLPLDLDHKKVIMKSVRASKKDKTQEDDDIDTRVELLQEIEDDLVDAGLSDLDDEDN